MQPGSGLPPAQAAKLDLNLSWRLQLGARYEFTDKLAVEFDWTRTGWSEFDRIEDKRRSTGTILFSDINAWKDTDAYRLGLTYDVLPGIQRASAMPSTRRGSARTTIVPACPTITVISSASVSVRIWVRAGHSTSATCT